jgi:hypothetical protein
MIKELREVWVNLIGAVDRNENVGAPTITALFDLVYNFLGRFVIILSHSSLREEVLANVACQLVELRLYFATFQRNLSHRCTRKPYGELAQFAGSRYICLLGPAVRSLLDVDGCSSSFLPPAALPGGCGGCGGGGGGGLPAAAPPPVARRKLGVSFADGGAGDQPPPPSPFPHPPPSASPGPGRWPGVPLYATFPAAYYLRRARPTPLPATTPSCPRLGAPGGAATLVRSPARPRPRPRLLRPRPRRHRSDRS